MRSARFALAVAAALVGGAAAWSQYPAPDGLTEFSADAWGAAADSAVAAVSDDALRVKAGAASIRFDTDGGFDTWLWNPSFRLADWDLSGIGRLRFWVYAENPSPYGFQNRSPWVRLGAGPDPAADYFQYQTDWDILDGAINQWLLIDIPLSGDPQWQRTENGLPNLAQIDWIEIHADTWDYGFTLWIDGLEFVPAEGALPPPANLTLTPFYSTTHVQWDAVADPAVVGYEVYRRTASGSYAAPIKRVLRTSFTDYGLAPGDTYFYKVIAVNAAGTALSQYTPELATTLDTNPALYSTHKNFEVLMVVYRGGYSTLQFNQLIAGLKLGLEFYWRTTLGRMNMDVTWLYLDGYPPGAEWYDPAVIAAVRSHGVQDHQFDLAYLAGNNLAGCLGGYLVLGSTCASLGTTCGVAYPGNNPAVNYTVAWTYTHEIHHALELMEDLTGAGTPEVMTCHFPWAYPGVLGPTGRHMDWGAHFDGIGLMNRVYGNDWMTFPAPFDGYIECVDQDGDGLPDNDARVWCDEARFGSNPLAPDSDADGLDDLHEYAAYNFRGADPWVADTDGDGLEDGVDPHPLYKTGTEMVKFTTPPTIDGTLEPAWPLLVDGYYYTRVSLAYALKTYAGWDDDALYLAFESNRKLRFMVSLDGSGPDGRFESPVRHVSGATDTYNADNKGNHIGDSWGDGNHIYFAHGLATLEVWGRGPISGGQVASTQVGNLYRTEVRIPRVLPAGAAYTWYPPNAPVVDGLTLTPGHVLGLCLTVTDYNGSSGAEFSGTWTSVFETHAYVDYTLVNPAPPVCAGDCNCDAVVSWRDIDYFIAGLNDNAAAWQALFPPLGPACTFANLDVNGDGHTTWRDIDPFIAVLNTICE